MHFGGKNATSTEACRVKGESSSHAPSSQIQGSPRFLLREGLALQACFHAFTITSTCNF